MKSFFQRFSLIAALALFSANVFAQTPATPGPEHEAFKKLEGAWIGKVKMGDEESTGTLTSKLELGGLWLLSNYKGEMMGQKFEGRGMDTYDPVKKKYISVWIDSMSARPMVLEGTYDKEKKTLTMRGDAPTPEDKPFKMVTQIIDDDHHKFTMYTINPDKTEEVAMTIDYTRKK